MIEEMTGIYMIRELFWMRDWYQDRLSSFECGDGITRLGASCRWKEGKAGGKLDSGNLQV